MQQVMGDLASKLTLTLAPMLGSFLVIVLALAVVRVTVRSKFVRQLAAYAAAFVWVGWLASLYKVV